MNKQIKIKDNCFHYLEFGKNKKEVILCLHGYADSAAIFNELGRALKNRYRVLALDFPMIHLSEKIQSMRSLTHYVSQFICTLRLPKITLVGFSLGGLVAINYAYYNPHQIKKLFLLNSVSQLITAELKLALFKKVKPMLTSKKFCWLYSSFAANQCIRRLLKKPYISTETIWRMKKCKTSIFGTAFNMFDSFLTDKFNSLSIPKTVVFFRDDEILKWKKYKNFIRSLDCDLVIFDKGGHASKKEYWRNIESLFYP